MLHRLTIYCGHFIQVTGDGRFPKYIHMRRIRRVVLSGDTKKELQSAPAEMNIL